MSSRVYSSLDYAADEIRLLAFQQAHPFQSSQLRLSLHKVSLASHPKYQALSYVWGTEVASDVIVLNGTEINVRPNLYSALCHLENQFPSINLWCDALCINQEDIDERNRQVLRMKDIYSGAKQTLVWLGEKSDNSDLAISCLRTWDDMWEEVKETPSLLRDPELKAKLLHPDAWNAIHLLLQRPWWTRRWVIQEFILSQSALFICGSSQCEVPTILKAKLAKSLMTEPRFQSYLSLDQAVQVTMRTYENAGALLVLKEFESWDFIALLRLLSGYLATDPRDTLYALLGLRDFAGISDVDIRPNYSHSVLQVYSYLVKALIDDKHNLSIIGGAGIGDPASEPPPDFPSWVPDLNSFRMHDPCELFAAAGHAKAVATISAEMRCLSARGIIGGAIDMTTTPQDRRWQDQVIDGQDVALSQGDSLHPTGIPRLQAFFRTLICDNYKLALRQNDFAPDDAENFFDMATAFLYTMILISNQCGTEPKQLHLPQKKFDELATLSDHVQNYILWRGVVPNSLSEEDILEPFLGSKGSRSRLQWPTQIDRRRGSASMWTFVSSVCDNISNRIFFSMEGGYFGLAPTGAMVGDWLCVLLGCSLPLLIRPQGQQFQLVGSCYVYGMMHGELLAEVDTGKRHLQTIELV